MTFLLTTTIAFTMLTQTANVEIRERLDVAAQSFSVPVRFDRSGFTFRRYLLSKAGHRQALLSCYSLGDQDRENFARRSGSDPVADLSCYLHDLGRPNEYTALGLPGESLQFSPAFFWLNDISKCKNGLYNVHATVRGLAVQFHFSGIDIKKGTATMNVSVLNDPSAKNLYLQEGTYTVTCS